MCAQWDALACARALESNALAYALALTGAGGGQVLRQEDAILTVLPFDYFTNGVYLPRFSPATARQRIEGILSLFRTWNLGVRFRLGPSSQPPDLARFFERPRFTRRTLPYMACLLSQARVDFPVPPGLQVRTVDDYRVFLQRPHPMYGLCQGHTSRTLLDMFQKLAQQQPRRHWMFVAEREGEFLASAELYLHEQNVSGRGFVVLKSYRRQGIGAAMLQAMYTLALEQGAELAVLGASGMGTRFYPHFGFQHVGNYLIFSCNRQRLRRVVDGGGAG